MERIFANLYRASTGGNRRGTSHTYFLKRGEGNILVCHQSRPSSADIDEMEGMGGVQGQFICHQHDAVKDGFHEGMHERFGCQLYHHKADRAALRKKTKCPYVQFDDEGLQYSDDFEVVFLPTCTAGHSIFRWHSRGKYYLFTSHAIYMNEGQWDLQFNPHRQWQPLLQGVAKLHVDYVFPGYTADEEFYRLDDAARRSLSGALRAKSTAA